MNDTWVVEQFQNFLSWGVRPAILTTSTDKPVHWMPPAVVAYALGYTTYCPPKGTM